jgi:hypothetical protein
VIYIQNKLIILNDTAILTRLIILSDKCKKGQNDIYYQWPSERNAFYAANSNKEFSGVCIFIGW